MWRLSRIVDQERPKIICDYNDNTEYALRIYDKNGCTYKSSDRVSLVIKAKFGNSIIAYNSSFYNKIFRDSNNSDVWEGHLVYDTFKTIIRDNIPCIKLHKVHDVYYSRTKLEIVIFLTGNWDDVF